LYNLLTFVSKGAIAQLTRALAIDHGADGIRVNGVCPGWIEAPMNSAFFAIGPHIKEQASRLHPICRIGQPEEVAASVAFLASNDASFITGTLLNVDGGITSGLAPALGVVI
jgi:meso-butanediol dehydrogenase/(S,S)-butanediol dehydrogenase/diacetyl reductase